MNGVSKKADPSDWGTQIVRFLAGQLTETQLIDLAAKDEGKLTDADGFIGVKYLLDGDRMLVHFQWDREHGSHSHIAHQLARTEYAKF